MNAHRHARLRFPVLALVTDTQRRPTRETTGEEWLDDIVRDAVLGGVTMVQLREKHLPRGDLIALGLHVRDAIAERALFFVNGDAEAAIALDADGVHLPSDGASTVDVRGSVGERMLISRAVHSKEQAVRAEREGVDLLVAGTLFVTRSKPDVTPLGVDALREICASVELPVIAIGGIDRSNARSALVAGARGVAVIGAISDAGEPRQAAAAIAAAMAGVRP